MIAPTFEIVSLGDASYLYAVINAVSSINGYATLGALGALLGLLIMSVQAIAAPQGPSLDLKWLMVSIIIFYVMFIPRVDKVIIVEASPPPGLCKPAPKDTPWYLRGCAPRTYVVDNVPLGLAATGYVVSTVGSKISQLFDTTFGSPTDEDRVLTGGVGNDIRLLSELRQLQDPVFSDPKGELEFMRRNLSKYIANCTLPGIERGDMTATDVLRGNGAYPSGDSPALSSIRYPHPAWYVELYLPNRQGTRNFSCRDAWDFIAENTPDLQSAFMNGLSADSSGGSTDEQPIGAAFQNFASPLANQAQDFMMAAMIAAVTSRASLDGRYTSDQQAGIVMVEEAAAKRAAQAAGEASMFTRLLRPTVAFFEALFYALAPIMALLLCTGQFGLRTAFRYLQMTLWVLLWFPLLSIINLYTHKQMETYLSVLGTDALHPQEAWSVVTHAIDAVGTSSTLTSAVPILAMTVIFGGPYAMSFMANKLQGSDVIDEKKMSPDAYTVGAAMQQQAVSSHHLTMGGHVGDGGLMSWNLKDETGRQVASSFRESQSSQVQFQHSTQSVLGKLEDLKHSERYGSDSSYTSAVDRAESAVVATGQEAKHDRGQSAQRDHRFASQTGATGQLAGGPKGAGGSVGANVGGSAADVSASGERAGSGTTDSTKASKEHRDALVEGAKRALSHVVDITGGTTLTANDTETFARSASDALSKEAAYQEIASRSTGLSESFSFDESQVNGVFQAGAGANATQELATLHEIAATPGIKQAFDRERDALVQGGRVAGQDLTAAALWRTFTKDPQTFPADVRDEVTQGYTRMAGILSQGHFGTDYGDATANRDVAESVRAGSAQEAVGGGLRAPSPGIRGTIEAGQAHLSALGGGVDAQADAQLASTEERRGAGGQGLSYSAEQRGMYDGQVDAMGASALEEQGRILQEQLDSRNRGEELVTSGVEAFTSEVRQLGVGAAAAINGIEIRYPANRAEEVDTAGYEAQSIADAQRMFPDKSEAFQRSYAAFSRVANGATVISEDLDRARYPSDNLSAGELREAMDKAFASPSNVEMNARSLAAKNPFKDEKLK